MESPLIIVAICYALGLLHGIVLVGALGLLRRPNRRRRPPQLLGMTPADLERQLRPTPADVEKQLDERIPWAEPIPFDPGEGWRNGWRPDGSRVED